MKSGMQDCYEAAGRLISTLPSNALLCNGWVFSTKPHLMKWIKHAWVELDDIVFDYSNSRRLKIPKDDYYYEGKIKSALVIKYSRADAIKMLDATRRFEFWSDEQRAKVLGVHS